MSSIRSGIVAAAQSGPERARSAAELTARAALELGEIAKEGAPTVARSASQKLAEVLRVSRKPKADTFAAAAE
jgi:hypothetical protein